ncbi:diguanylate cyclase domain-containing protein [Arcobacter sp.]|uniref:diguanylate cyclase domain-containing protein n=1 Tax=Arcobacter sp. TaxID=1872629 RepID=UPI003D0EEDF3
MNEDFNNSTFSLSTKEEFENLEDTEICKIIEKYKIIKTDDKLLSSAETNYVTIIEYLDSLYYLKKDIPEDLAQIITNHIFFNKYLVLFIGKKLDNILKNGSALFFKDINSIINLLSRAKNYKIFKDYNTFNYDEVQNLFREYESSLQNNINNEELFDAIFDCYTSLLKVYTKLCLINSIDIKRKQTINPITDILTETINMLKFSTKLKEKHINNLNNILGQILYYFSHLPFIDSKGKDLDYLIAQYFLLFEKISDGYYTSKDTNFGENSSLKEEEYFRFRSNSSYLFLIMLKKLHQDFGNEQYLNNNYFKKYINLYEKNFSVSFLNNQELTLDTLTEGLLNSLALSYITDENHLGEIKEYRIAINDFIIESDNFNIQNIESIHNILLLADKLDKYHYVNIGQTLINSKALKNDYYEFYKLKTLDVILNHLTKETNSKEIENLVRNIYKYIEKNKVASQLMPMFSKLYLSISYYFSKLHDFGFMREARDIYSMFININGFDLLKNEYSFINTNLLKEFGKFQLRELDFFRENITDDHLISLGKIGIRNYIKYGELKTKYEINNELVEITSDILNTNNLNYEKLNSQICSLLTNKIYYGICEISILGLTRKISSIVDEGYKRHLIPIDEEYSIQFIFPAIYENNFKYINSENEDFIVNNLKNILSSYKKESQTFTNKTTGLENIHKLKLDLSNKNGELTIFIQILVKSFSKISQESGFKVGEKYLQAIINKISTLINQEDSIYYLNEGKIGIILQNKDNINRLIDRILQFKINKNGEEVDTEFVISVTIAQYDIYNKSVNTLDKAIISKNNLLFYEE